MTRLLIAEMQSAGHHARYVRWILQSPFFRDKDVVLAGPRSLFEHSEISDLKDSFTFLEVTIDTATAAILDDVSSLRSLWRRQTVYRSLYTRAFQQAQRSGSIDLFMLPYTDHALDAWAILGMRLGRCPLVGINMQPVFHLRRIPSMVARPRRDDWIRERLFRRFLRTPNLVRLLTIDPAMPEFVAARFPREEAAKIEYLPDPSVLYDLRPGDVCRTELGIPEDAFVVLLYGALSLRKGVRTLILAASSDRCPGNLHILLAGRHDADVKEFLDGAEASRLRAAGRLHEINRYLDDELERTVLSASNAMWVGYIDFYRMSGILVLAARHGMPSLFTRQGIIGYLGRKLGLGVEIDPHELETVTRALGDLVAHFARYRQSVERAGEQLAVHTVENFQDIVSTACEQALASRVA